MAEVSVRRFVGDLGQDALDALAVEEPLEVQLMHGPMDQRKVKSVSVTMRTPGHDFELVAGFLLTEGMVGTRPRFAISAMWPGASRRSIPKSNRSRW